MHVSRSPMARCTSAAATPESTPPDTPQMARAVRPTSSRIRELVGRTARAICGVSGGVDSGVAAALVHRAMGERLTCIFVDHGLVRLNERERGERAFRARLRIALGGG